MAYIEIMNDDQILGRFKYEGTLAKGGIIDAKSAATALHGIDKALRFFIEQQRPGLAGLEIPVPVKIETGSWVVSLPTDLVPWLHFAMGAGGTAFLASYATEVAKTLAKNDFKDVGLKDVFKKAAQGILWTVRLAKHLGSSKIKKIQGIKWRGDTEVGVPNAAGEYLYVPVEYLEMYLESPDTLLTDMIKIVERERVLTVSAEENGTYVDEVVTENQKAVFDVVEENPGSPLFPQFKHGQHVKLEGFVTRGNGTTNTIGFRFDDHILTCQPTAGRSVVDYKPCIFEACTIEGSISRADNHGVVSDTNRPHIIFDKLITIGPKQPRLFE